MGTAGWIILGLIVLLGLWLVGVYNRLVNLRQRCRQAFADIDVQLKQRHDLVPNLVETVKGYASHERGTLEAVIKARNAAMTAQGPAAQAQAEGMLQGALRQLFAELQGALPDLEGSVSGVHKRVFLQLIRVGHEVRAHHAIGAGFGRKTHQLRKLLEIVGHPDAVHLDHGKPAREIAPAVAEIPQSLQNLREFGAGADPLEGLGRAPIDRDVDERNAAFDDFAGRGGEVPIGTDGEIPVGRDAAGT